MRVWNFKYSVNTFMMASLRAGKLSCFPAPQPHYQELRWFSESSKPGTKNECSMDPEIDFNRNCDGDGLPVLHSRIEFPLADGGDGFFVQPRAERLGHLNVLN